MPDVKQARASAKFVRITPRKARAVINLIRGKNIQDAIAILKFTPKRASTIIHKVLKSAVANAENNFNLDPDKLVITSCAADQGPTFKRYHPRSRGQAFTILKHSAHITITVTQID